MTDPHGIGRMGQGSVPGMPIEGYLFKNFAHGGFIEPSSTGSSQVTGTGDGTFLYNVSQGIVIVDGTKLSVGEVDAACEAAADIFNDGESREYAIIAWKHPGTGTVALKSVPGTVATSGSEVRATDAEIEAVIVANSVWILLGTMTIARTAATTVTEAVDHIERPTGYAS